MTETASAATRIEPMGVRVDAVSISRHAGAQPILQSMSVTIEPGELVAIAGGSGAGKTTLLEILAGLQSPSAGEVRHDGVTWRVRTESRYVMCPRTTSSTWTCRCAERCVTRRGCGCQ